MKFIKCMWACLAALVLLTVQMFPVSAMEPPVYRYPLCLLHMACHDHMNDTGKLLRLTGPISWTEVSRQRKCRDGYLFGNDMKEVRVLENGDATYYICSECHRIVHIYGDYEVRWKCQGNTGVKEDSGLH